MTDDADRFPPLAEPPPGGAMAAASPYLRRFFKGLNRWFMVPAHHAGLGAWVSTPVGGWILLLRVRGRKSGIIRETPLNYLIADGAAWIMAGFGRQTEWYRNLLADPSVEVRLPGRAFTGTAEEVLDPAVRARLIPALVRATGLPGMMVVPSPMTTPDEEILDATVWVPLIRLRPADGSELEPGPDDPGGRGWIWRQALVSFGLLLLWRAGRRALRPGCDCCSGGGRRVG
ncbi:MAG: nitroreductase/quinone reductase family protein [Candidatus Limnocylindrales bacterium]